MLSATQTPDLNVYDTCPWKLNSGSCSTVDAHDRWEDWLAVRLDAAEDPLDFGQDPRPQPG